MKVKIGPLLALAIGLILPGVALASGPPSSLQVNLFFYNLTPDQVAITYPDPTSTSGTDTTLCIGPNGLGFMGAATLNTKGGSGGVYDVTISDLTLSEGGTSNQCPTGPTGSFQEHLSVEGGSNCDFDTWRGFLQNYQFTCYDNKYQNGPNSYDSANFTPHPFAYDGAYICLQGGSGNAGLNSQVGLKSVSAEPNFSDIDNVPDVSDWSCNSSSPPTGQATGTFENPSQLGASYPVALGTYTPTSTFPAKNLTLPGISPGNVTPCIGSECNVPNVQYWPVTLYYDVDGAGNGVLNFNGEYSLAGATSPTSSITLQTYYSGSNVGPSSGSGSTYNYLGEQNEGVNIPSYLSSYAQPGSDDAYIPPVASSIQVYDDSETAVPPAPCWPTYNTGSSGQVTFTNCSGIPAWLDGVVPPSGSSDWASDVGSTLSQVSNLITIGGLIVACF